MTQEVPSKYGAPLTGSDWVGLPLRIGHMPESGRVDDLVGEVDAVLVWTGGPSDVAIVYEDPAAGRVADTEFERTSGMIDLLPSGTRMYSVCWSGKPSTCTSVNFPPSCLAALTSVPMAGLDVARGPQFGLLDPHVVDLVRRLQGQAEGVTSLGAVYVQSLSLALASYVSGRYGRGAEAPASGKTFSLSRIQRTQVESFVEQELATNFGLVDLASITGYSPDHFSRLFKQSFAQSPYQYVLSRRVERARTMLRDESLSIAEIALACGFSDQGHLTKAFKQRVGMTPGAYRKG